MNDKLEIGLRNGFANLLTFSINGIVINPNGTAAIAITPNNLFGNTRSKLKVGKKYHSGKISSGVLNGSAGSPNCVGANTATTFTLFEANVQKWWSLATLHSNKNVPPNWSRVANAVFGTIKSMSRRNNNK